MEVKLQKVFPIGARAEAAWKVLTDIPAVAACMPGAAITEQLAENRYKGNVKVKIGPASAAFDGDIDVLGMDVPQRKLQLLGKGQDSKGTSGASMDLVARIVAVDGDRCELHGDATVTVSGKIANFGGRMMEQVSEQLLKQFAANFDNRAVAALATLGPDIGGGADAAKVAAAAAKVAEQPRELSAFSLFLGMVKSWFARLFHHA